jgi:predicted Ser/Thr protein kinase
MRNFGSAVLGPKIGSGKQGDIYEFYLNGKKFIIKINNPVRGRAVPVNNEREVAIQQLAASKGIAPKVLTYTKDYIVMEPVDGITVEQYLFEGGDIDLIIDQIDKAVDKLHSVGIRHNDLLPSNIMITRKGNTFKIYIIDYGSSDYDPEFTDDDYEDDYFLGFI